MIHINQPVYCFFIVFLGGKDEFVVYTPEVFHREFSPESHGGKGR